MGDILRLPGAEESRVRSDVQEPNCAARFKWNRDVQRWQNHVRTKGVHNNMPDENSALLFHARLCKVRMGWRIGAAIIGWSRWQIAIDAIYPIDVPPELLLKATHVVLGSDRKYIACTVYKYHVGPRGEIRLFILPKWRSYRAFKRFVNTDLHRSIYTPMDCIGLVLPKCCTDHAARTLTYYHDEW